MVGIFQLFPLAATISGLSIHEGVVPVSFCKTPAGRSGSIGAIACLAIIMLFLAYKMRHVHDAYFLKKELNLLGFESLFVAAPSLISTFITVITHRINFDIVALGMDSIYGHNVCFFDYEFSYSCYSCAQEKS